MATVPHVPTRRLAALTDGFGGLGHEALSYRARLASPLRGLFDRPGPHESCSHGVQQCAQTSAEPLDRLVGVNQPRRGERKRHDHADGRADHRVEQAHPAEAHPIRPNRRQHNEHADRHLPRGRRREPQHQLGDSERHCNEHTYGEPVQAERVTDRDRHQHPHNDRGAALDRRAQRHARTDTWTTTSAVSGARTGSGMFVTTLASHHDTPAANPDFATVAISVEVGRVHDTAFATRCQSARARLT